MYDWLYHAFSKLIGFVWLLLTFIFINLFISIKKSTLLYEKLYQGRKERMKKRKEETKFDIHFWANFFKIFQIFNLRIPNNFHFDGFILSIFIFYFCERTKPTVFICKVLSVKFLRYLALICLLLTCTWIFLLLYICPRLCVI